MSKNRLGKGLGALIPGGKEVDENHMVALEQIEPNPYQPRRDFNEENLHELAQSIKEHGIIQPILLKEIGPESYAIVAGERRWRAAKLAGLARVPAIIKEYSDREMMEMALIENLQREDLSVIEEANAYKTLITEFKLTQEEVAKRIGKSRPTVANTLRLLALPEKVQEYVSRETISMGHARALLSLPSKKVQEEVAERIIALGLNVRQTEMLVQDWGKGKKKSTLAPYRTEAIVDWERDLFDVLGTKVKIRPRSQEKGVLQIEYRSMRELEKIYNLLGENTVSAKEDV